MVFSNYDECGLNIKRKNETELVKMTFLPCLARKKLNIVRILDWRNIKAVIKLQSSTKLTERIILTLRQWWIPNTLSLFSAIIVQTFAQQAIKRKFWPTESATLTVFDKPQSPTWRSTNQKTPRPPRDRDSRATLWSYDCNTYNITYLMMMLEIACKTCVPTVIDKNEMRKAYYNITIYYSPLQVQVNILFPALWPRLCEKRHRIDRKIEINRNERLSQSLHTNFKNNVVSTIFYFIKKIRILFDNNRSHDRVRRFWK